jgi:tRNA(Arg) A34 adenosine deaminase TadA
MPSVLSKLRAIFTAPSQPPPHVTDLDTSMMRRALDMARKAAAMGEVPVGAVVYQTATGVVLGEAHNRRESDKDPSAHAEHLAIIAASRVLKDWRLTACTLAVTLEPCPMCAGLIVNARLGRVIYGASDPKAGAMGSLMRLTEDPRLNHRVTPIAGVLAEESAAMLKDFFKKLRGTGLPPGA